VIGSLILIPLLVVAGTPIPNNLLQMKEGILVPDLLIYITGALDPNSVLYTTGTLFSKFRLKFNFNNFDLTNCEVNISSETTAIVVWIYYGI